MSTSSKRYDDKLAIDHDQAFRVRAKGVKLLGLWAAERMGLPPDQMTLYAAALVSADFEEPGDEDILRKLNGDLAPLGVTPREMRDRLAQCLAEAAAP